MHAFSHFTCIYRVPEAEREKELDGRLTLRFGGVTHAWQREMMIVREVSRLRASVSARCP